MANSVFENAVVTLRQAISAVESEVTRLSTVEVRAQGAQQHLDALRVQQRELQATVNELASQIAETKSVIAQSEASAKSIIEGAKRQKTQIIEDAKHHASMILEDAHRSGEAVIAKAHADSEHHVTRATEAKNELVSIRSQMETINKQVDAAKSALSTMRQLVSPIIGMG